MTTLRYHFDRAIGHVCFPRVGFGGIRKKDLEEKLGNMKRTLVSMAHVFMAGKGMSFQSDKIIKIKTM